MADVGSEPGDFYARLSAAAAAASLACRGGFTIAAEELPEGLVDGCAATVVLLGFNGAQQWAGFVQSPEYADGAPHPLDRWSMRVIGQLAQHFAAHALYPFDGPPWWPFQQWARRAQVLHYSPLGILMDPQVGLWHAYRGALLFRDVFATPALSPRASPCASCTSKPCIANCPTGAVRSEGFNRGACAAHLQSLRGATCHAGCLARLSCPIGAEHRYGPEQSAFYMRPLIMR